MNKEMKGKRIILREQREEDAPFFAYWFNQPQVMFQCGFEKPTDEEEVKNYLVSLLRKQGFDKTGLIYGMGHAVYTLSDPRAVILKRKAMALAAGKEIEREFRLLDTVEKLTPELMKSVRGNDKVVCANVDMYSGLAYRMLGIPDELFTPLFATARMVGWAAHRMEEILTGKRIIRPAYKAIAKSKEYVPLCDR